MYMEIAMLCILGKIHWDSQLCALRTTHVARSGLSGDPKNGTAVAALPSLPSTRGTRPVRHTSPTLLCSLWDVCRLIMIHFDAVRGCADTCQWCLALTRREAVHKHDRLPASGKSALPFSLVNLSARGDRLGYVCTVVSVRLERFGGATVIRADPDFGSTFHVLAVLSFRKAAPQHQHRNFATLTTLTFMS
jgi:hypothetical protein